MLQFKKNNFTNIIKLYYQNEFLERFYEINSLIQITYYAYNAILNNFRHYKSAASNKNQIAF